VGGTKEDVDIVLERPAIEGRERVAVQVKSMASQDVLDACASSLLGTYDRAFFVYHTGDLKTPSDRMVLIDASALARLVVDAGLVSWLLKMAA